jgi:tRNA-(ms[2]io[6]A)-hydroxylase
MLGLKLPTDPRWSNIAERNIDKILIDHAWCEQKAASNAIALITINPEKKELVNELLLIAQEELDHFQQVLSILDDRKIELGREEKDSYVNELYKFVRRGGSREQALVDRLLFSAMVEARSCERFRILSTTIDDTELAKFYHELMISEAGHYKTFIGFARKYGENIDVSKRWEEWLEFEAGVISSYGKTEAMHG